MSSARLLASLRRRIKYIFDDLMTASASYWADIGLPVKSTQGLPIGLHYLRTWNRSWDLASNRCRDKVGGWSVLVRRARPDYMFGGFSRRVNQQDHEL